MDRDFDTAPQKLQQDLNSFGGWQKPCHDCFESLQRSFRNLDGFADFKRTIERDDLIGGRTERVEGRRFDCRHMVSKSHESRDAVGMNHPSVKFPVNEFCEQIAWEHRFHEPDRPAASQLPEPNARGDNRHLELAAESFSRQDVPVLAQP